MSDLERAALRRQARCLVHPVPVGGDADRAVAAIVAWERANPDAGAARRERASSRITQLACYAVSPAHPRG
jgi:hypothetical protein